MTTPVFFFTDIYSLAEYAIQYRPVPVTTPRQSDGNSRTVESEYMLRLKAGYPRRIYKTTVGGESHHWVKLGREYRFRPNEIEEYINAEIERFLRYVMQDIATSQLSSDNLDKIVDITLLRFHTIPRETIATVALTIAYPSRSKAAL